MEKPRAKAQPEARGEAETEVQPREEETLGTLGAKLIEALRQAGGEGAIPVDDEQREEEEA